MSFAQTYTIDLPFELAQKAEEFARRDCKSMSDVLQEALRVYSALQVRTALDAIGAYAASRNAGYTDDDIPGLIAEVRSEHSARA